MLATTVLAFLGGFLAADGLTYFMQGSSGRSDHPLPFPKSPTANVIIGWIGLVLAAVSLRFAQVPEHPLAASLAIAAGVLALGLVHARIWPRPQRSSPPAARTARRRP